eukprot:SAG31_NODE_19144_length_611_cov_0.677734_1_plen_135_part_10
MLWQYGHGRRDDSRGRRAGSLSVDTDCMGHGAQCAAARAARAGSRQRAVASTRYGSIRTHERGLESEEPPSVKARHIRLLLQRDHNHLSMDAQAKLAQLRRFRGLAAAIQPASAELPPAVAASEERQAWEVRKCY